MDNFIYKYESVGQKIRYLRTIRNMKQFELAKGICSVSYLSKVENGSITPSEEIKNLLLERLNAKQDDVNYNEIFFKKLSNWKKMIANRDLTEAEILYNELQKESKTYLIRKELNLEFQLLTVRYYIIIQDFKEAQKYINEVKEYKDEFSLELKYYYYRYIGEFYYYQYDFKNAFKYLKKSITYLPPELIDKDEKAQLYYSFALTSSKENKFHISIIYGTQALQLYQSLYDLKRCIECHILLGIASRNISNYEDALEHYKTAKKISQTSYKNLHLYTINHNLGALYSFLGDSEQALNYYMECYNSEDVPENKIETIICIIEEMYNRNDIQKMKEWIKKGINYVNQVNEIQDKFMPVLELYQKLAEKEYINIDKILIKVEKYFEEQQKLKELSEILRILAEYEYNNSRYKLSANYYSLSRDYLIRSKGMN